MTKETEKRVATGAYVRTFKSGKKSIRVNFRYRHIYCRETLRLPVTAKNIRCAINLRNKILKAIALGDFNYTDFFPDSKNAIRFGHVPKNTLVEELVEYFLQEAKVRVKETTYNGYQRICNKYLLPAFGRWPVSQIRAGAIWVWLKKFKCQRKTLVNILTPLRFIISEALVRGYLDNDPLGFIDIGRLGNIKSSYKVNPLNQNEINKLLSVAEPQIKNLFQFAFYTGLRTGELIGLRWEDIDLKSGFIRVRRCVVQGKIIPLKTKSSNRSVQLLAPALNALLAQKFHTYDQESYVLFNPKRNKPWVGSEQLRKRAWIPLFEKAGVEYRNPYQVRHTFASMMTSSGENFLWVSQQMGHETPQTTARFYTRWLPNPESPGGYQPVNHW